MSSKINEFLEIWWVLVSLVFWGPRVQGAFYNCTQPGLVALTFGESYIHILKYKSLVLVKCLVS